MAMALVRILVKHEMEKDGGGAYTIIPAQAIIEWNAENPTDGGRLNGDTTVALPATGAEIEAAAKTDAGL